MPAKLAWATALLAAIFAACAGAADDKSEKAADGAVGAWPFPETEVYEP